jgi:hypothetical protein
MPESPQELSAKNIHDILSEKLKAHPFRVEILSMIETQGAVKTYHYISEKIAELKDRLKHEYADEVDSPEIIAEELKDWQSAADSLLDAVAGDDVNSMLGQIFSEHNNQTLTREQLSDLNLALRKLAVEFGNETALMLMGKLREFNLENLTPKQAADKIINWLFDEASTGMNNAELDAIRAVLKNVLDKSPAR